MEIEVIENITSILPLFIIQNNEIKKIDNLDNPRISFIPSRNSKDALFSLKNGEEFIENGELKRGEKCFDGAKKTIVVNRYERDSNFRSKCIKAKGSVCEVCGCDFSKKYGERGKGFIEVHHRIPLYKIGHKIELNLNDLIPVCSNCHSMLHRYRDEITIEELKDIVNKMKNN